MNTPGVPKARRRPTRVDAGITYDHEKDAALLRIRPGGTVAMVREVGPRVFCDEDAQGRLMGLTLVEASRDRWEIESTILHYRALRKLGDGEAMLLRYLAGGLRAALSAQGALH